MSAAENFAAPLRIVVRRSGAAQVLALSGAASMDEVDTLEERLNDALNDETPHVIVDCSQLAFISSSGIGAIIAAYRRAQEMQGTLQIASPSPTIAKLLQITHIDQFIPVRESVEVAERELPAA